MPINLPCKQQQLRRGVLIKRGGRRRRKRRPKSQLNRTEREQKLSLLHHPQRRGIRDLY
jgi:hypothetical protein